MTLWSHRPAPPLRCAGLLIRTACRRLPEVERAEREMEWSGESEAAACDPDVRFKALRTLSVLWFALSLVLHAHAARQTQATVRRSTRGAFVSVIANFIGGFIGAGAATIGVGTISSVIGGVIGVIVGGFGCVPVCSLIGGLTGILVGTLGCVIVGFGMIVGRVGLVGRAARLVLVVGGEGVGRIVTQRLLQPREE